MAIWKYCNELYYGCVIGMNDKMQIHHQLYEYIIRHISKQDRVKFYCSHNLIGYYPLDIDHSLMVQLFQNIRVNKQKEHNSRLLEAMSFIQNKFLENNMEIAFLKGPLLGSLLYGDTAIRTTNDIDVLVDYHQAPQAFELLSELGFVIHRGEKCRADNFWYIHYNGNPLTRITGRHTAFTPESERFPCQLELHISPWRSYDTLYGNEFAMAIQQVFSSIQTQNQNDQSYYVLSLGDSFIQLCCHYTRHILKYIMPYCLCHDDNNVLFPLNHIHDIAAMYVQYIDREMSANELFELAKRYHCIADLFCVSAHLKDIYGLNLLDQIYELCMSHRPTDIENQILYCIATGIKSDELIFGNKADVHDKIKKMVPAANIYHAEKLLGGDIPSPVYYVTELTNNESITTFVPGRPVYDFLWGVGYESTDLKFRIEIPKKSVAFSTEGVSNSIIKILLSSGAEKCLDEFNVSFHYNLGKYTSKINSDSAYCSVSVEKDLFEIIVVFKGIDTSRPLRFKIVREVKLFTGDDWCQLYDVRIPRFDDTPLHDTSCLNADEIVFDNCLNV